MYRTQGWVHPDLLHLTWTIFASYLEAEYMIFRFCSGIDDLLRKNMMFVIVNVYA